ncbi:DiGeorge syndrome critical region protein 14 [Mortierella antarctica]|nr:DiGeorge syndrome critical region protein 14 [Mortierella antarctica]
MSSNALIQSANRKADASPPAPASTSLVSNTTTGKPVYKSNIPTPAPQQVLEEDEYIEALSKIIERDFFPDLAKLKRQHAYLDAVEMNDTERIQAAAKALAGNDTPWAQRRLKTPARTPRYAHSGLPNEAWTPARVDIDDATPTWQDKSNSSGAPVQQTTTLVRETPSESTLGIMSSTSGAVTAAENIDTSLSLDQFQARYTSEDNASFNEIVEKINARKKEKYRWMYDQENQSQKLIEGGRNPKQLLLRQAGEDNDTTTDAAEEDPAKMSLVMAEKKSGIIPTWDYKAKNTLMYFPEGLGTQLDEKTTRGNPKEIVHRNTSFQGQDLLVVNQAAASKFDPAAYVEGQTTDSPRVAGYGFVSSTPSPSMSQMGDDPEMMTWGTIEDEPLLISSGIDSSSPSPFKLPPTPRRELIAQKLSEKASKSFREGSSLRSKVFSTPSSSALALYQSAFGGRTPTPRFNSPYPAVSPSPYKSGPGASGTRSGRMASPNPRARAEMLSPAAKSLLDRARNSNDRRADRQLRSSYERSGGSGSEGARQHAPVTPSPLARGKEL